MIDLEAMEAGVWNGAEKPNNRFSPPFHRAWKTLRPKSAPSFPQFPQLRRRVIDLFSKKKNLFFY